MKSLNIITLILVIVGALNWGLMGLFQVDLVATIFGGPQTALSRIIYILVGLSGVYQLIPLINALSSDVENPQNVTAASTTTGAYDRTTTTGSTGYNRDVNR